MTEADTSDRTPTSVIFRTSLEQLRQQDPRRAASIQQELEYHFGKLAINQGLPLEEVIASDIERRMTTKSDSSSFTPENFVTYLFSPDSENQQVSVLNFMRRFILGEDNK